MSIDKLTAKSKVMNSNVTLNFHTFCSPDFNRKMIIKHKNEIDSVIFVYSGHGKDSNIIFSDGKPFSIFSIHSAFDNDTIEELEGKPKIFLFDCCRGADQEFESRAKDFSENK